jgi:hypothetical protein
MKGEAEPGEPKHTLGASATRETEARKEFEPMSLILSWVTEQDPISEKKKK